MIGPGGGPLSVLTLRFDDPQLEASYQRDAAARARTQQRAGMTLSIGLWLASAWLLPILTPVPAGLAYPAGVALAIANVVAVVLSRGASTVNRVQFVGAALNIASGLVVVLFGFLVPTAERFIGPGVMLVTMFPFLVLRLRFVVALVTAAPYVLGYALFALSLGSFAALMDLFLVGGTLLSAAGATYALEAGARRLYWQDRLIAEQQRELAREKDKSDRLLRNILPDEIAARLRDAPETIADGFDSATVLFADLVGFTPLAERLSPEATVALLNGLFSRFDDLVERHGVEKIKTIGDAYMVAGGVPRTVADHADRVVALGLDMLDAVRAFGVEFGHPLDVRIGVHSGPIVAGVLGKRKFSYDLWGDTVNTASRLESHGVPGAVQVSEATRQLLDRSFVAEARGNVELRGKGPVVAYLVTGRATSAPAVTVGTA